MRPRALSRSRPAPKRAHLGDGAGECFELARQLGRKHPLIAADEPLEKSRLRRQRDERRFRF